MSQIQSKKMSLSCTASDRAHAECDLRAVHCERRSKPAGLRPERDHLRPEPCRSATSRRQVDAIYAQQVDDEMGTDRYALLFKPGIYGTRRTSRCRSRWATTPRSPGWAPRPTDVVINGKIEVYNRCLDDGGTSNCLALVNFWRTLSNLSLNDQRRGPGRLPGLGQLLGRLPGRVDAPGQRQRRQPVADGLLHGRAAVRQRRLHRRLEAAVRHQRLAAAVADPQQRGRRLVATRVWNQVFSGVDGRAVGGRLPRTRRTRRSRRRR